jgi:hypothetical protein
MFTETMRRAMPYGWVAVALAFLYVAGVFLIRHADPIRLPGTQTKLPDLPAGYYGTEPKIESFYTGSPVILRGEHAVICYGTRNIAAVRLDPPEESLTPSLNRCFAVSPVKTTTYTLTAVAKDGRTMSESFTVRVDPAPPKFTMISISAKEIVRGDRWAICYSTENATSVRLEPQNMALPVGAKRCSMFFPAQTTNFRLVAYGENGMKTVEKIPAVTVVAKPNRAR